MYGKSFKDDKGVHDATEAFVEFHGRSRKAGVVLNSLPKRPAPGAREKLLEEFEVFRAKVGLNFFKDRFPLL